MKLKALEVKNFKGIKEKITIFIDEIVILIGPNNCCKSTVLDAYEAYYSLGAALSADFFNEENSNSNIEIAGVFIDITDEDIESIGQEWLIVDDEKYGRCSKFKIIWEEPEKAGKKYSYSNQDNDWKSGGAGGWNSILQSKLPVPIRIEPFDTTEKLETVVKDLISKQVAKAIKNDRSKIAEITEKIKILGKEIESEIQEDIDEINSSLFESMNQSFPDTTVYFDTNVGKFEPDKAIKDGSQFIFTTNNMKAPLINQGSGVQRAFLWSAIKAYSEKGLLKRGRTEIDGSKPKILLLDEPEINLHPSIIRSVREALYSLSEIEGWQVICTTHSPIFIDLSKDHTTIIKVSNVQSKIKYFQTDNVDFDQIEKDNLKMINLCNPITNEFFFYDDIILVEGETEETALKILFNLNEEKKYTVLNCRGKANIPTFIKILNKFETNGIAIHDLDNKEVSNGNRNPMWTINEKILEGIVCSEERIYGILNVVDFEDYYLQENIKKDKPYNVYKHIMSENFQTDNRYEKLRNLVSNIRNESHPNKYKNQTDIVNIIGEGY